RLLALPSSHPPAHLSPLSPNNPSTHSTSTTTTNSELSCPICLGTFECPSTLSCGHSFCLRCLDGAWERASRMAAVVVCDTCDDRMTRGVKTCLRCEMSLCEFHLKPHLKNPKFKDHVLVAPIVNVEERRCKKHEDP
uniref:RING-type domain-containing protein n=1 Tax=Petromyzon marinus TaxID=7757 RepID=S4RSB8_PETMA